MMPSVYQIGTLIAIFLLFFLPIILVIKSPRVHGGEKIVWIVVAFLFSWLGYIGFYFATKKNPI